MQRFSTLGGRFLKKKAAKIQFVALMLMAIAMILPPATAAAGVKTVAIVPFKVNSEKDVNFMRDGIYDMLSSRLYKEGEVEVLGRQQVEKALVSVSGGFTESKARDFGRLLGADFVLFGSLTVLGNSISLDSKMVDAAGAKPTLSFFEQSEDAGGIVSRVNQMAAEINDKIFGRTASAKAPAGASPAPTAQSKAPDTQAHPEKMFRQQAGLGPEDRVSPFKSEEGGGGRELSPQFWRSAAFKQLFNGIALGDVDGDGKIETVILTAHSVLIYRKDQERFFQVHEYKEDGQGYNIGVDVADINGNGVAEIFVTSLTPTRKGIASFVLEHDGKSFRRIAENQSWYFRVSDTPDRGKILIGQEHRMGSPHGTRIYEMLWRNGRYEPESPVNVSIAVNVLGLTLADVTNNRKESVVAFDREDYIRVFEPSGKEEWKSAEKYGGSTLYYSADRSDQGDVDNPIFLPMRLLSYNPAKDGKTKILAVKNFDIAGGRLEKFRSHNESQVMSFFWDGLGLAAEWRTRKISGAIRDFAIGDFDNDGQDEFIAALILEEGRIITTDPKCTVIALEFK
jgi:TolB-like protein